MSDVLVIGESNGVYPEYAKIIKSTNKKTIQIGNLTTCKTCPLIIPPEHKFIQGSHDNISLCRSYENFCHGMYDPVHRIMTIGGASDVYDLSTQYNDLSISDAWKITDLYVKTLPEIVISYTAPAYIRQDMFGISMTLANYTENILSQMFTIHKPKKWIFANQNISARYNKSGTEFISLKRYEVYEL